MLRSRIQVLFKLLVLFGCLSLTFWFFVPDTRGTSNHHSRVIIDDEPSLPSGIQSYLRELRALPNTNTETKVEDAKTPRILCLILTKPDNLNTNVAILNTTWVTRCHTHFFVLNTKYSAYDIINTPYEETRANLVYKVRYALTYIYTNHADDFDWIIKADDDTYVIMENLQFLLSHYDSSESGYLGFHFAKMSETNGFMSGGAGYVISNRALRRMIEFGLKKDVCPVIPNTDDLENSEDLEIGRCLNISGVPVLSSIDALDRETFHPYPFQQYLISNHLPEYLYQRALTFPKLGLECCSRYSISFHYMSNEAMLVMDHLLYRMLVYGKNDPDIRADNKQVFKIETVNVVDKLKSVDNMTAIEGI